ncbi:hypothetical protein [Paenibacillus sp. JZ16]|uniref:hypothetical protein n=1 Tax=Paenibacillus sp. JZ16 TaxID=1906272 RepID=UPI00188BC3F6|nr:hypothetical protein [Paenibacillus sp. JZ16]
MKIQNMEFKEKSTEEIAKVYTQNFDLLFHEVPVQINREIILYENAFSVIGLISYWINLTLCTQHSI